MGGFYSNPGERQGWRTLNNDRKLDVERRLELINTKKEDLTEISVGWAWEFRDSKS